MAIAEPVRHNADRTIDAPSRRLARKWELTARRRAAGLRQERQAREAPALWPRSLSGYSGLAAVPLETHGIAVFPCRGTDRARSEQRQLVRVFLRSFAALARMADDTFILAVREGEDVNLAARGQVRLDATRRGLELFLAVAETGIYRKLALLGALGEQEFAKGFESSTLAAARGK